MSTDNNRTQNVTKYKETSFSMTVKRNFEGGRQELD